MEGSFFKFLGHLMFLQIATILSFWVEVDEIVFDRVVLDWLSQDVIKEDRTFRVVEHH